MSQSSDKPIGADKFIHKLNDESQTRHATQRYQRGFSDIDMWNFDGFIADLIVAGCDWMIANGVTSPWKLDEGDWHDILRKIKEGFTYRNEFDVPDPPKDTWRLLRKNFRYMWD